MTIAFDVRWGRFRNLLGRLVAPGPKADHVSASECHEIHDDGLEALDELERVEDEVTRLKAWVAEEVANDAHRTLFDDRRRAAEFGVSEAQRIAEGRPPPDEERAK